MKVYFLTDYNPSWNEAKVETQGEIQRQELKPRDYGRNTLTGFLPKDFSASFTVQTKSTSPGTALLTVGCL